MEGVFIMNKKWDLERVREFVDANSKCELISTNYINYTGKLIFKCECGNEFEKGFNKFSTGNQRNCPECGRKRINKASTKDNIRFVNQVKKQVGNEYTFLEEYKGARTKIRVKHNACNHEYSITPDSFLSKKRRCSKCNGGTRKTVENLKEELIKEFNGEYELVGVYNSSRSKTKFKHKTCGYIFEVSPDNLLRRCSACHKCNTSFGEKMIIDIFEDKDIEYKHQYSFDGLKRHLFDFVILSKGKPIAIEYDGIQHFEPVGYFGGERKFKVQQKRDEIKNAFCKENDIQLIRIPYWEVENIETILENVIN